MKVKLFYSFVGSLIILLSVTLYLSSCQKEIVSTDSFAQSTSNTSLSSTEREDPPPPVECPDCMGTIVLSIDNVTLGLTYSFDAVVQARPCSFSPWTIVKKYKVNPYSGAPIIEPIQLSQDNYYRLIVTNTSAQSAPFSSSISSPGPHNTTYKMVANLGNVPPGQSVVGDYYKINTTQLGRANCGCILPFACQ